MGEFLSAASPVDLIVKRPTRGSQTKATKVERIPVWKRFFMSSRCTWLGIAKEEASAGCTSLDVSCRMSFFGRVHRPSRREVGRTAKVVFLFLLKGHHKMRYLCLTTDLVWLCLISV